jgi:hypothetical protein
MTILFRKRNALDSCDHKLCQSKNFFHHQEFEQKRDSLMRAIFRSESRNRVSIVDV